MVLRSRLLSYGGSATSRVSKPAAARTRAATETAATEAARARRHRDRRDRSTRSRPRSSRRTSLVPRIGWSMRLFEAADAA